MRYNNHTFVICAYGENIFLEDCIKSIVNQSVKSNVILTTSTDNEYIREMSKKYNIKLYVSENESDIARDWNYAYKCANTGLVTLVHQDDIYDRDYLYEALKMIRRSKKPLIYFTDYYELRDGNKVYCNINLSIKRLLLYMLRYPSLRGSVSAKKMGVAFGNAICCPSVTYVKKNLPEVPFEEGMRSNIDWELWVRLAGNTGEFVYNPKRLMGHRIYEDSETSSIINDKKRQDEDTYVLSKMWPVWISNLLEFFYKKSEKSNKSMKKTYKCEKNGELISVIMPVYNGEAYLGRALSCIDRQSYDNIEVIAINDGSTDSSLEVLKKIQKRLKKTRLIILDQENKGISAARNAGIEKASGEYLMFMDQDDLMKKDLSVVLNDEQQKKADMSIGGVTIADEDGKVSDVWHLNPELRWSRYKITAPWGRIYKKELIDRYGIRFKNHKISEDLYFNMVYISYAEKISVIDRADYIWIQRPDSESHANMSKASDDRNVLAVLDDIMADMNKNSRSDQYVEFMFLKHIVWYLLFTSGSSNAAEIKEKCIACQKWISMQLPDAERNQLKQPLFPDGESIAIRLIVFISLIMMRLGVLSCFLTAYSAIRKIVS